MTRIVPSGKVPPWSISLLQHLVDTYGIAPGFNADSNSAVEVSWIDVPKNRASWGYTSQSLNSYPKVLIAAGRSLFDVRWCVVHEACHLICGFRLNHSEAFYMKALPIMERCGLDRELTVLRESYHSTVISAARRLGWQA